MLIPKFEYAGSLVTLELVLPEGELFGPVWGNYPEKEDKIRADFDPNRISAPEPE